MKTVTKNPGWEGFSNPINRNLILILVSTLAAAIGLVTGGIVLLF